MKYTFIQEEDELDGRLNGNSNRIEFEAESLSTLLERFEQFLRGSGYYFEGLVDIVPQEEMDPETSRRYDEEDWSTLLDFIGDKVKEDANKTADILKLVPKDEEVKHLNLNFTDTVQTEDKTQ